MKPFYYYQTTTLSHPHKNDYTIYYVYHKGEKIWEGSYEDYKNNSDIPFPQGFVFEKYVNEEAYKEDLRNYNLEINKLRQEFKNDLFEEFGVTDNPKREKCFQLAVDYRSSNLENVYEAFADFVDLIK
jgi:hypothetical protein